MAGKRKSRCKPFPKTRKFGDKKYHTPSFHRDRTTADHIASNYRKNEGGNARVVPGRNILGETRYVVYRHGGSAESAKRVAKR